MITFDLALYKFTKNVSEFTRKIYKRKSLINRAYKNYSGFFPIKVLTLVKLIFRLSGLRGAVSKRRFHKTVKIPV